MLYSITSKYTTMWKLFVSDMNTDIISVQTNDYKQMIFLVYWNIEKIVGYNQISRLNNTNCWYAVKEINQTKQNQTI